MKHVDKLLSIKEIYFDEGNPRILEDIGSTQKEIQDHVMKEYNTQNLLKGMQNGLVWSSRLVVTKLKDQDKYVVIEGNRRLACLKSGQIAGVDENTEIPVVEIVREKGDSDAKYNAEIKKFQGVANVSAVKEWRAVAKAKFSYTYFRELRQSEPETAPDEIIQRISEYYGDSTSSVKRSIVRYALYTESELLSGAKLNPSEYSYIEAVAKNERTKTFFGLNSKSYDFEWHSLSSDTDISEQKKLRLQKLPQLINSLKKANVTTSEFRSNFEKLVLNSSDPEVTYLELAESKIIWGELKKKAAATTSVGEVSDAGNNEGSHAGNPGSGNASFTGTAGTKTPSAGDEETVDASSSDNSSGNVPEADSSTQNDETNDNTSKGNKDELMSTVYWNQYCSVVHEDHGVDSWPVSFSFQNSKVILNKKHKIYPSICKQKNQERVRVLLGIHIADRNASTQSELLKEISDQLVMIWR